MSTNWAFDHIENKHSSYCGEGCMKKLCQSLKEHAKNIIDFEKQKRLSLTKKELKSHQDAMECYTCGKRFMKKFAEHKKHQKVRGHFHFTGKYRRAPHSICNFDLKM